MQWILLLLGALVALFLVLVIAGFLLPRNHRATSWIELKRPPSEVWPVVRDLGQVPSFWPEIKAAERKPDRDGHEAWSQTMKNGFEMGALSTGRQDFYARIGWERWAGPSFVRQGAEEIRTEGDDGGLMVLRFGPSEGIDLAAPISCEHRNGDVW